MLAAGVEKRTGSITISTWRRNHQVNMRVCCPHTGAYVHGPREWHRMTGSVFAVSHFYKLSSYFVLLLPKVL